MNQQQMLERMSKLENALQNAKVALVEANKELQRKADSGTYAQPKNKSYTRAPNAIDNPAAKNPPIPSPTASHYQTEDECKNKFSELGASAEDATRICASIFASQQKAFGAVRMEMKIFLNVYRI
ncbi:MAG: hypothetical protein M3044_12850 [Thermoproteota archaeon]|nr:hypothetical protein [Thermoproteota archaeon]